MTAGSETQGIARLPSEPLDAGRGSWPGRRSFPVLSSGRSWRHAVTARVAQGDHLRLTYRPELDGIRGLAIALVVFSHASGSTGLSGQVGVTLFFVLSGYLITGLLTAEHAATGRVSLRTFYERRARRLLPALALFLAVCLAMGWVARDGALAIAFYVANWIRVAGAPIGYLGHTWSLGIEEQFYIFWPLAFIAGLRRPRVLLALAIGVVLLRYATAGGFHMWSTVTRADGLLVGCAIALAGWQTRYAKLGLVALLAVALGPSVGYDLGITAAVVASAFIVAGARPGILTSRPLVWLGGISYALYLWHLPIIEATGWPVWIAVPAAIGIAWTSTRYLENPIRRWRRSVRPAPAAATAAHEDLDWLRPVTVVRPQYETPPEPAR